MSLNLCQFIGNLGKDPEVRYMPNGDPVANFSIGVSQSWKDKATGEKKEATEWVRCTAYGKLAEVCGQYLKKGKQVYVSGRMNTRKWQDKEGQDRYTTEINVDQMQMLGGRDDAAPAPAQRAAKPKDEKYRAGMPDDGFDDQIPF